jgi:hypothetical protein
MLLTIEKLKERVNQFIYRPGWTMEVYEGAFEGPMLHVRTVEDDTTKPGEKLEIDVFSPIPPMLSIEQFDLFIHWRLKRIEIHESMEFLRLKSNGRAVFYPHLSDRNTYNIDDFKEYRKEYY